MERTMWIMIYSPKHLIKIISQKSRGGKLKTNIVKEYNSLYNVERY